MSLACLFPGQGALRAGMGLELAQRFDEARALLEAASEAAGRDLQKLLRVGGSDIFDTRWAQPCAVAICLGAWARLIDGGLVCEYTAGLSLGELPAFAAAGGLTRVAAVEIAAARGALMGEQARAAAADGRPGGMVALNGDAETAERAVRVGSAGAPESAREADRTAALSIGGHTAPTEWTLSGGLAALDRVAEAFECARLPVSGAWHSEAMRGAVEPYLALLRRHAMPLASPDSTDLPAAPRLVIAPEGDPVDHLANKLVQPDRWVDVLRALVAYGVTDVLTMGPGRVIASLVRRTLGERVRVHPAGTPAELEEVLACFV